MGRVGGSHQHILQKQCHKKPDTILEDFGPINQKTAPYAIKAFKQVICLLPFCSSGIENTNFC